MIFRKTAMVLLTIVLSFAAVFTVIPEDSMVQASSRNYQSMEKSLNAIMNDSSMKSVNSSITVRKASTGEIIYQSNGMNKVTPASTLKLLTSAAALETLGEGYRFRTDLLTDGSISKGVLKGNIYLRGQGDPTLLKSDLDQFAANLAKMGVKQITGNLIGDDTWFDSVKLSPGIDKNDETYYYAAQIAGLTLSPNTDYDAGTVIVNAQPAKNGYKAKVTLTPDNSIVTVVNKSKTVPKGYKNTLSIKRQQGTNNIVITGNVPVGSAGSKQWVTVSNPTAYTLDVFKKSLASKGIKFTSSSKTIRGQVPLNAKVIASKQSMPLKNLMKPFMKLSNNTHAEILAKTMGRQVYGEGSWDTGLRVMREYAQLSGLNDSEWLFEDASGISHNNKVSSEQLSELLFLVRFAPWYGSFVQGLPISGMSDRMVGGTLKNRLTGASIKGKVTAKTGSLNNVNSLAGYVQNKHGETLIFTVLIQGQSKTAIPIIDRIATILVNS
ncbi:D-alanyl-D-alanine carboxypeptidase/D-alanyl-D-alanine endopeptidase [Sporosarcina highlanderae]|uniref:D-alanyl-D-alanine carboxypeptidase/D-alanyl-D-alanine-endopeptidase n=1 Tax=Sporosarcina highlanderae TaxID=3035916 RepID=A0ABT8JRL4_9BACL|nr:D-alanyl-D-alanine carboxypeptidase/D-alanyl-D-alanine-endopeptidase [Sporosarcina highlanderae]MDN4607662.1 D-alanyl-D-alanine carboxypeptidase/D-alanyl-D-alanine-endopeptidase [Sporosarcina highlanderae]